MRRPELPALLSCCALLLAACATPATIKPPKIKGSERIAPTYQLEDSAATKRRVQVGDLLGRAAQRYAGGEFAEAEKLALRALKLEPSAVDALSLLGAVDSVQGNAARAGERYRRAAELAPQRGDALNNYGAWLCANQHPAEALIWFDRALAAPGYATPAAALANAGGCALESGQVERAGQDLDRALELDPANAYALASMARLQFRQGRYLHARAFNERRLAAAPADASVLQLAVKIEERLGDRVAASRYQQRLREEFPHAVTANPGEDPT
ncbi:type IV pilus biogenesis/stability protein PilW [Pseudoxanthomonas broegbernensis]|uniref:Type IV pilus biogenesis/stability protein PilW n=1 Tax=Pseudoxanthomonas broegbernensis TaxID=83619 RepID=A0A7V8K8L7_9GAMM|nr:type IV pilus biogenesis/stability protein PilW [Pseudoxanthomonas broegbernensis]KAF1687918.1 type IV pilus biogenesis/stability protein PilW [Pseudoxanthomonas broegbernensis]MBB6064921.1 type IV pilus assembly protein PilF [Pseudoxanthomonas broegbernensis]